MGPLIIMKLRLKVNPREKDDTEKVGEPFLEHNDEFCDSIAIANGTNYSDVHSRTTYLLLGKCIKLRSYPSI